MGGPPFINVAIQIQQGRRHRVTYKHGMKLGSSGSNPSAPPPPTASRLKCRWTEKHGLTIYPWSHFFGRSCSKAAASNA